MASHCGSFCIKSVKPSKVEVNIPHTDNFNFGNALASVYPLLELIFKNLAFSDLTSCLKVSSSWREEALKVLSKRIAPSWFSCYKVGSKGSESNILKHSSNLNYNNVELGIILYVSHRIKLNQYICLHSNIVELSRKSVPEYLEEELVPMSVDYCVLSVNRVVSCFNSDRSIEDIQYNGSIFEGVFIPKIPSVRTVMFHYNYTKKKDIKDCVNFSLGPNEELKCLLLFCKTQLHDGLYKLLEFLVPKNSPDSVALGGGIIRGTKSFQQKSPENKIHTLRDTVCIAFIKDTQANSNHNFNAFSCVIKGGDLSKEECSEELLKFRTNVTLRHYKLGFRLCCSGKYCQETELQSFQEIFPGIPLLGLDANGEIGWNSYPNATVEHFGDAPKAKRLKKSSRGLPIAAHYFSTVFVLITWD